MDGYLLSSPGDGLADVIEAVRALLAPIGRKSMIAYLPLAADGYDFAAETEEALHPWATVHSVRPDAGRAELLEALSSADLVYLPGGDTWLLAERLERTALRPDLAAAIRGGLPFVGFSAGAVITGADILASNDPRRPGVDVRGLRLLPVRLAVHVPTDPESRGGRLERLRRLSTDGTPVVALADQARIRVTRTRLDVERGQVWVLRDGMAPEAGVPEWSDPT